MPLNKREKFRVMIFIFAHEFRSGGGIVGAIETGCQHTKRLYLE